MESEVDERLGARFDRHEVRRRLHDVPPHEVYEVSVDGRRAVYKANVGPTGSAGVEGRVMRAVGDGTSVPVPEPLVVADDYFVAAWHPDAPAPEADHEADEAWARAAGRGLATLHDETASMVDAYGAFRPDGALAVRGREEWRAAAIEYVRERRPVLARYGHADVADWVLDHLTERPGAFDGAGGPVCCHGWATPEHVAVADGEVSVWSTSNTRSPRPASTTTGGRWSRRSAPERASPSACSGRATSRSARFRTGSTGGSRATRC
ncbi:hypothetical protein ABNG03_02155 [Halorubrum sp. RMP-47]|uniref:Aminoglycoside phosphotransferase domain-containing protein n=1 Tax=Halorubrum miltondacostae TaxID=3076378 RepID=A0ABD5LYF6_9EURY